MHDRFETCLATLLHIEGGYSNRPPSEDPGGATKCGVTWRTYNAYRKSIGQQPRDVREMTEDERRDLYYRFFWLRSHADDMPAGLDLAVFDFSVNSPLIDAMKMLQRALGLEREDGHYGPVTDAAIKAAYTPALIQKYMAERRTYCVGLRNYWANKNGWATRWATIEREALQACGAVEWAAKVEVAELPAGDDARSHEQSRAIAEDASPPLKTALTIGGGGGFSGLQYAIPRAFQTSFPGGRFSATAFGLALVTEPLFWAAVAGIWGGVAVWLWHRKHKR